MRVAIPLVTLALLAGCASDPEPAAQPDPVSSRTPAAPSAPAASPVPTSPGTAAAGTRAVAVYWLGATEEPRGPRLYREFVRRPAAADAVRDAVETMLGTEPRDADYR